MEHLVTTAPVAALIGAGAIAPFHIAALRAAGFDVGHLAASKGSRRAAQLAQESGIPNTWSDPYELIDSNSWDAIVIAASTEAVPDLLSSVIVTGKPCLVEKPVAFDPEVIRRFAGHDPDIRVAYNRRLYDASSEAKGFAGRGPCLFRMELPDGIGPEDSELAGLRPVRENSVHGLDLLAYVVGRYRIDGVLATHDPRGRVAVVTSEHGHVGTIVLNWNCPANFSLVLDHAPQRFELRPFELGTLYDGMDVVEPSSEVPVRRYVPKAVSQTSSFPGPDGVKPGFLAQATSLMRRVREGAWDERSATIDDAVFAADVARVLTDS